MTKRVVTHYTVSSPKLTEAKTFAVVTDLHNGTYADVIDPMRGVDGILIVGDLINRHKLGFDHAAQFLHDAPLIAPTYYAIGNHEWKSDDADAFRKIIRGSHVQLMDNHLLRLGDIVLGALSSRNKKEINTRIVTRLASRSGFRLLMCHHPEWYPRYIRDHGIDLTLSGHAHGGQCQLFGRGLYAPGQGILPRYTHGFYDDGHLLVSRGMHNSNGLPRFGNPCELILLHLQPGEEAAYR